MKFAYLARDYTRQDVPTLQIRYCTRQNNSPTLPDCIRKKIPYLARDCTRHNLLTMSEKAVDKVCLPYQRKH